MKSSYYLLCLLFISSSLQAQEKLTLRQAFEKALKKSEVIAIKGEDIRIAEGHYLQAWGEVLPHIDVKATEFIQDTSGNSSGSAFSDSFTRRSKPEVAITASQPIFQGLREYYALSTSSAEKRKNVFLKRRAQELLFSDVTKTYYSVIELQHEHDILKSLLDATQKRVKEISERIRLGKSRQSEVLVAESQQSSLEADIQKSASQLAISQELLSYFIGEPLTQELVDEFNVPDSLPNLEKSISAAQERSDIKAQEEAVRLAKGKVGYERGAHLPDVRLGANYYPYRVGFQQDIKWDMMFTAKLPIFSGGATAGRVKEAKAMMKQAEFASAEKKRTAEKEIRQALASLDASQKREKFLKQAESKSGQNYQAQVDEYRLGLVNNLEVLQSLKDWQQLRLQANLSHYQTKLDFLNLKVTEGHLPIVEDLLVKP